ncbi:MAG: AGE family epimerase/isomerase, partial [Caulobacterales bacterium]|nr:AGE family epimerase/isomerase [Caulobacterales bacterium]
TGFGYIHVGPGEGATRPVQAFVEKPILDVAKQYLDGGQHLWNAGIFLFRADAVLAELERHEPELLAATKRAVTDAARASDVVRLDASAFGEANSISIDYAVMERAANVMVTPVSVGWNDIGSWEALWRAAERDEAGVARIGDVLAIDSRDCYARTEGPLVALAGVSDLAVIASPDAVMIAPLDRSQEVKAIVGALNEARRSHAQRSRLGAGRLQDRVIRLRSWLMDDALPLWAERGVDERGAFYEGLTLEGQPDREAVRRFRVQARQIYVFSHAAEMGWSGPASEIVQRGLSHFADWRAENGGWPHLLTPDLGVQDATFDAYDQAFALLAFAWAHKLTGDRQLITLADETLAALDATLGDPATGGYWDTPARALPRRQNPHMHLLEANMALHDATGEARYLDRARGIVEL